MNSVKVKVIFMITIDFFNALLKVIFRFDIKITRFEYICRLFKLLW